MHSPRVVQLFRRQRVLTRFDVFSESDHAGCLRTRKSTSGCVVMTGVQLLAEICLPYGSMRGAAMSSRRGLGRVKHIHTTFLWIQAYVTGGINTPWKETYIRKSTRCLDKASLSCTDGENDGADGIQIQSWQIQHSFPSLAVWIASVHDTCMDPAERLEPLRPEFRLAMLSSNAAFGRRAGFWILSSRCIGGTWL